MYRLWVSTGVMEGDFLLFRLNGVDAKVVPFKPADKVNLQFILFWHPTNQQKSAVNRVPVPCGAPVLWTTTSHMALNSDA